MFLALGIATVIYVAVSLGVFGTLSVEKVIDSGGTALAVAAQPVLGRFGYWLITVTALFATSGATNAGLFPIGGLCAEMASIGQFPPVVARELGGRLSLGLLGTAVNAIILVAFFDLNAVASIGSAVALVIFTMISVGHVRVRTETGAKLWLLVLAIAAPTIVFLTFAVTTLVHEPATITMIVVIVGLSIAIDLWWKQVRDRSRDGGAGPASAGVRS